MNSTFTVFLCAADSRSSRRKIISRALAERGTTSKRRELGPRRPLRLRHRGGNQEPQGAGGAALPRPARPASRDEFSSANKLAKRIWENDGTGNQSRTRNSGAAQRLGASAAAVQCLFEREA